MSVALFAVSPVLAPLQALVRWLSAGTVASPRPVLPAVFSGNQIATKQVANYPAMARAKGKIVCPSVVARPKPPLRVVRVLEAGQARASVGRMVISGRMADVCAELDRLAAREAALHH